MSIDNEVVAILIIVIGIITAACVLFFLPPNYPDPRLVMPSPDGSEVEIRMRTFKVERRTWEDVEGNELFREESVVEVLR